VAVREAFGGAVVFGAKPPAWFQVACLPRPAGGTGARSRITGGHGRGRQGDVQGLPVTVPWLGMGSGHITNPDEVDSCAGPHENLFPHTSAEERQPQWTLR
jgi:hypothetical protein